MQSISMQTGLWLPTVLLLTCLAYITQAKYCSSFDIRNDPVNLRRLQNCTVIVGFLKILLFDIVDSPEVYDQYSFPELVEITGYLFLFKVSKLRTLENLFPNLRVIRGTQLFLNYALVIYEMPSLSEVGLKRLVHIGRGDVRIDNCPHLCYVYTIDWMKIGATKVILPLAKNSACERCPEECNGLCWNCNYCQNVDLENCHPECVGCTQHNSPNHCIVCKNYNQTGTCVDECSPDKYMHEHTATCVTYDECKTMLMGDWWTFQQHCINTCPPLYKQVYKNGTFDCEFCGDECRRFCWGAVVDSLSAAHDFLACTHVNGSLEIRATDLHVANEVVEKLAKIQVIFGSFRMARTHSLTSLDFLDSLRYVGGEEFMIFENDNLEKLWTWPQRKHKLIIESERIVFHNNPKLCVQEIYELANQTDTADRINFDLVRYGNGFKSLCNFMDLNITVHDITYKNVTIRWQLLEEEEPTKAVIGYTIYYLQTDQPNITAYEMNKVCESKLKFTDHTYWVSHFVSGGEYVLHDLNPFTRYAFYIEVFTKKIKEQTKIHYFTTKPHDPTEPLDVQAFTINETAIRLAWRRPLNINGVFSHYQIIVFLEYDNITNLQSRDYCKYDFKPLQLPYIPIPSIWTQQTDPIPEDTCECDSTDVVNMLHEDNEYECSDSLTLDCKRFMYEHDPNNQKYSTNSSDLIKRSPEDIIDERIRSGKLIDINSNDTSKYQDIRVKNRRTSSYVIGGLRHYSMYIFLLSACNIVVNESNPYLPPKYLCGPVVLITTRTAVRKNADTVVDARIDLDEDHNIMLSWTKPLSPNVDVFAYHVEYKLHNENYSTIPDTHCVIASPDQTRFAHTIMAQPLRRYVARLRAVSLAGFGPFTKDLTIDVLPLIKPDRSWLLIPVVALIAFVLLASMTLLMVLFRHKRQPDNVGLIPSVNPDFGVCPIVEDAWELQRSDVHIMNQLGKGTFGVVYEGIIRSKNIPCAIKTIAETRSDIAREDFLKEGMRMKNFSEANHIVKLLGIVSRDDPPLVVMELMEHGDLKRFLHGCREPSRNLTLSEMYRMAVEIADGMAFLAAIKFVHRDLAARNCMVHADRTVKVGDFGMARDIYVADYYRKGNDAPLPVRWMSPESLADGVFTTDSDCWSYGIVLWEIATLAEQPYQGRSNRDVFHYVTTGGVLNRPEECSDKLYDLMHSCWNWDPNERPTFRAIVEELVTYVGDSFRMVAFCYSKKGQELAMSAAPRPYNPPALLPEQLANLFSHETDTSDEEDLDAVQASGIPFLQHYAVDRKADSQRLVEEFFRLTRRKNPLGRQRRDEQNETEEVNGQVMNEIPIVSRCGSGTELHSGTDSVRVEEHSL